MSIAQDQWRSIVEGSVWDIESICEMGKVKRRSLLAWINQTATPNKVNLPKVEKLMKKLQRGEKRLKKHASFGYVAEEQIARLGEIGLCPERDRILKDIDAQTRSYGKKKKQ